MFPFFSLLFPRDGCVNLNFFCHFLSLTGDHALVCDTPKTLKGVLICCDFRDTMRGIVLERLMNWLEGRLTSLSNEEEINDLRQKLLDFEFHFAEDDDFHQVIPQNISLKKKMLVLKAFKNIRGRCP